MLHTAVRQRSLKDEDRACVRQDDVCGEPVLFLLVADGHGGAEVAQLCAEVGLPHLLKVAADAPDASGATLQALLSRTFEWLQEKALQRSQSAGATLTICAWVCRRLKLEP